ncbi:MAG: hypothetical protein K0S27_1553 [Gammaproteobacteria bacterium]|jgi:hypothetical protein|nr:hypothetical protein [Gammaproteobacteria bacterium]
MKRLFILISAALTLSLLTQQTAMAWSQEASKVECGNGKTVAEAASNLNTILNQDFFNEKSNSFVSAPVIQKLDNGTFMVCATFNSNYSWSNYS